MPTVVASNATLRCDTMCQQLNPDSSGGCMSVSPPSVAVIAVRLLRKTTTEGASGLEQIGSQIGVMESSRLPLYARNHTSPKCTAIPTPILFASIRASKDKSRAHTHHRALLSPKCRDHQGSVLWARGWTLGLSLELALSVTVCDLESFLHLRGVGSWATTTAQYWVSSTVFPASSG